MPEGVERLTQREREVYSRILMGQSSKEICTSLGVSIHTVRFHISNILRKFKVASRFEMLLLLLGSGKDRQQRTAVIIQ